MVINRSVKGIIFDLDGTLFHLNINWPALKDQVAQELGVSELSYDEMIRRALPDQLSRITPIIDEAELQGAQTGEVLPGVSDYLPKIAKDYKLAIVTRNSRSAARVAIKKIGFSERFIVVAREDVSKLKPHPEAMELALQQLQLQANEVIIVGDTTHDVASAQAIGAKVIVVRNPKLSFAPKGADDYIEKISDLALLLNKPE